MVFIGVAFIHVYRFGKGITLHESPREAVQIAEDYLREQKVDPAAFRHVAWINDNVDASALHYLAERKSLEDADRIYRQATRLALWTVRFYRPLQKEEYVVFVDPMSGEVFGSRHTLDENAPGASLTAEQAQALAEQAVGEHGYSVKDFELQSSDATKRKAREDYTLVWQAKKGDPRNVGEAHYRLQVDIAGDQVVSFARTFKLPEEWERAQEGRTLANNILLGASILMFLALVGSGLIVFINLVRAGQMQWKRSVKFGVLLAAVGFLGALNGLPSTFRAYDTSLPLMVWKLQLAVGVAVVPLLEGLFAWLLIGSAISLYPDVLNVFTRSGTRAFGVAMLWWRWCSASRRAQPYRELTLGLPASSTPTPPSMMNSSRQPSAPIGPPRACSFPYFRAPCCLRRRRRWPSSLSAPGGECGPGGCG